MEADAAADQAAGVKNDVTFEEPKEESPAAPGGGSTAGGSSDDDDSGSGGDSGSSGDNTPTQPTSITLNALPENTTALQEHLNTYATVIVNVPAMQVPATAVSGQSNDSVTYTGLNVPANKTLKLIFAPTQSQSESTGHSFPNRKK